MAIKKKLNLNEVKPNVAKSEDDHLIRMTMDQYISNTTDSYGRGYTDGLVAATLVVGAVSLGMAVTDVILNLRSEGKIFKSKKK